MTDARSNHEYHESQVKSEFSQLPVTIPGWQSLGPDYPTAHGWYNLLRPENQRDELVSAGVASFINGRWLIFPNKWQQYCANNHRPRNS